MRVEPCPPEFLDKIASYLESTTGQTLPRYKELLPYVSIVAGKAGEALYTEKERAKNAFLILDGVIQMGISNDKTEVIIGFVGPQEVMAAGGLHLLTPDPYKHVPPQLGGMNADLRRSLLGESPSHSAKAVTDYMAVRFSVEAVAKLVDSELAWSRLASTFLMFALAGQFQNLGRQKLMSAEERYKLMLREQPDLVANVQQKHLAQYLGVTPEGLSRISSRLRRQLENGTDARRSDS